MAREVLPCPVCGYDAPLEGLASCPHCRFLPREPSLRGPRVSTLGGVAVGLAALPRGLHFLGTTPRVKRWLAPPFLLTLAAFVALAWWLWQQVSRLVEALRRGGAESLPWDATWVPDAIERLLRLSLVWLAQLGGVLLFGVVFFVAALWAFSIVYEALAGPFLDEIHGRLEERWFGANPRDALSRPTGLSSERCTMLSAAAALPALGAVAAWWLLSGWVAWVVLALGVPLPFVLLGSWKRDYGRWLWWAVRIESGTLWVGIKASLVAAFVLVFFLPLKFVPFAGYVLFGLAAGFTASVSLLDIPFERRGWSLSTRFAFLVHHLPAVTAFGIVASLLFVVPLVGPVLMVPAASVGGLWLLCRLDKDVLRPPDRRVGWPAAPADGPPGEACPAAIEGAGAARIPAPRPGDLP